MEILEEKKGEAMIFSLSGRLDSSSSPVVEKKILDSITNGTKTIILDFGALEYLSSAGIRVLVQCSKQVEKVGGKVYLVSVTKPIENVLYITGFLPYFKVFSDRAHALKECSE